MKNVLVQLAKNQMLEDMKLYFEIIIYTIYNVKCQTFKQSTILEHKSNN